MPPPRRQGPPGRPGPGRSFKPTITVDTSPIVVSIDPNSSRLEGGGTVTIRGYNFRTEGSVLPIVTFGGVVASAVVVISTTSLTCTVPVGGAVGVVDVSVQCGTQAGTLLKGFTYYEATITSVVPGYGPLAGGTSVIVTGYNFQSGCTINIGGVPATSVVFIDSQHYVCTTPAHAVGHVDVEMVEPSLNVVTLRHGFQYTLLTRGEDIRRFPGIVIQDVLNNTPNTCTFVVDGTSNVPVVGEKIEIIDIFDSDRLLFAGNVQTVKQVYEGLITQLAYQVTCIDFTGLLNRRRPFTVYTNMSATLIVKDLIERYAPGFTDAHVQSNLAKVSITLDGTKDLATCFSDIAGLIGGGHWYVDYTQDVHFFHVIPPGVLPADGAQSPLGNNGPGTAMTVTQGAGIPSTYSFLPMTVYFRTTFVYDNGLETAYSPISNPIALTGTNITIFAGIPIGATLGGFNVVKRRIYYTIVNSGLITQFCDINDNVTTTFSTWFGSIGASVASVTDPDGEVYSYVPPPPVVPPPPAPADTMQVHVGTTDASPSFSTGWWSFAYSYLYQDGSESTLSAPTNGIYMLGNKAPYVDYLPIGPDLNGVPVVARKVFASFSWPRTGQGGIAPENNQLNWDNSNVFGWYFSTNNTTTVIAAMQGGTRLDLPVQPSYGNPGGTGRVPGIPTTTAEPQVPVWPNPDGPSLELGDPPDDIDDLNTQLLREPSTPFSSETDLSQVRNRIHVIGAGTSLSINAALGDTTLGVTDTGGLASGGGDLIVGNEVKAYFGVSVATGPGTVYLKTPLAGNAVAGTPVNIYMMCENKDAQRELGRIELDVNGNPTDGVHEFTIRDTSLIYPLQLYMRGNAELELFGRPIVSINYSTRDAKTKSGKLVYVNLTNPPCIGEFLIQSVTIDQIHDEGDDLFPRYTVRASSVKFDLTDLLLQILSGTSNQPNLNGLIASAIDQSVTADPFERRLGWCFAAAQTQMAVVYRGVGMAAPTAAGNTPVYDTVTPANIGQPPTRPSLDWLSCVTTASASNTSGLSSTADVWWIEQNFEMAWLVKTGDSVADCILWAGLQDATLGSIPATKSGTNQSLLAFRYSSQDGDGGWVGVLQPRGVGHKQTVTGVLAPCTPNTEYLFEMVTAGGPTSAACAVSFRVNGGAYTTVTFAQTQDATQTPAFNMPVAHDQSGGNAGLSMFVGVTTKVNAIKRILWKRFIFSLE